MGERVLVDLAVLHDYDEVLGRIRDQLDVCDWVAVDEEQVGQRAFFHDTQLAGVGVALSGHRKQLGVGSRGHDERLRGRIPADKRSQNGPLLLRQRLGEQDIGSPRRLDLVFLRQLVGPGYARPDFIGLGSLDRANRKALSQLLGERLRTQPHTLTGNQLGGGLVHQEAMFDTLHTRGNSSLYRFGRKGVHGDVSAPIAGRFNRRPQFSLRESRRVDRAVRRGDTAASGQLDLGGTLHELLADADAHLVGAVGDSTGANLFHAAERAADRPRQFRKLTEVAMTAGNRNHGAGGKDARSSDDTLVDILLQTKTRSAHVANCGESPQQRVCRLGPRRDIVVPDITSDPLSRSGPYQHRVPVDVDETWNERATAAIDDSNVGVRG